MTSNNLMEFVTLALHDREVKVYDSQEAAEGRTPLVNDMHVNISCLKVEERFDFIPACFCKNC